ncbi:TetR/AcrR family transcriptional regulator [Thalassotalea sp. PP2-459]|uniref:TetR/AcrR family transcriptional regulator n=1 Tax=Thalassotalea sp. PP2-459 TaxID=1742724 RepID=UPI0009456292|nr:TetR/AcrR family transcriptional regulator [Thalassotalea sp. PP2-459]OKY27980.1 TetR family transcriptional regulator [Thalassotalea sp. PP2-459]
MRDAEQTRQKILEITADEIHQHGFQATSLSTILSRCEISKGALYHHFDNKLVLGYAVFEEIFTPMFLATWQPAVEATDPIDGLCKFFKEISQDMSCEDIVCGCPVNNLCQEMSAVDEGFRLRILNMQQQLNHLIAFNLQRFSAHLRNNLDFTQVAYFIVSSFHGAYSLSKSAKNKELFDKVVDELCIYLNNLRNT